MLQIQLPAAASLEKLGNAFGNSAIYQKVSNELKQGVNTIFEKFDARFEAWEKTVEEQRIGYTQKNELISVYSTFKDALKSVSSSQDPATALENAVKNTMSALEDIQTKTRLSAGAVDDAPVLAQMKLLIADMLAMVSEILGLNRIFGYCQSVRLNHLEHEIRAQFEGVKQDIEQSVVEQAKSDFINVREQFELQKTIVKTEKAELEKGQELLGALKANESQLNREKAQLNRKINGLNQKFNDLQARIDQACRNKIAAPESSSYMNKIREVLGRYSSAPDALVLLREETQSISSERATLVKNRYIIYAELGKAQQVRIDQEARCEELEADYCQSDMELQRLEREFESARTKLASVEKLNQIQLPELSSKTTSTYSEKLTMVGNNIPVIAA